QPIDQRPHQYVERNGLEEIVLKEIDQPLRQRAEQLNRHRAAYGSRDGAKTRGCQKHDGSGDTGEEDPKTDEQQQAQAKPRHQFSHCELGRPATGISSSRPSIKTNSAISNNASLIMK